MKANLLLLLTLFAVISVTASGCLAGPWGPPIIKCPPPGFPLDAQSHFVPTLAETPPPAPVAVVKPAPKPKPIDRFKLVDIPFPYDADTIVPESARILDAIAAFLRANPAVRARIEGHSDERGTKAYNFALSDRRAKTAKRYLTGAGVDGARLETVSCGAGRPLDPGHNEGAWAKNRRAHFVIISE